MNASGTVVNAADHYPFGLRMPNRAYVSDNEGNRYQFTGHEKDGETNYDYHGARYYNSEIGRYISVDPMQTERMSLTPYNYVSGNPIMRVDPTGMLDDKYTVDETGTITLQEKTDDDYDMLYTESDWENENWKGGIQIKDKNILRDLDDLRNEYVKHVGTDQSQVVNHGEGNADQVMKVFKFMADNTNVEWVVTQGKVGGKSSTQIATARIPRWD